MIIDRFNSFSLIFFFVVYFCFFLADLFFIFLKLSLLLYLVFLVNFLFVGLSNASSTFCFSFLHENPRKQSSIRAKKIWNLLRSLFFFFLLFCFRRMKIWLFERHCSFHHFLWLMLPLSTLTVSPSFPALPKAHLSFLAHTSTFYKAYIAKI